MRPEKETVRKFYDTFGWQQTASGLYGDTAAFVDRRPALADYHHRTRLRVLHHLRPQGEMFLDAGSGAIPHPEYLSYSLGFKRRVCVDLSLTALAEARSKLGKHGFTVCADVTALPFRAGIFEGVVSAHVLYHVPADEQVTAVRELHRVLKTDATAVIVDVRPTSILTRVGKAWGWLRRVAAANRLDPPLGSGSLTHYPPLYYHPHHLNWFGRFKHEDWDLDIRSHNMADVEFTTNVVPGGFSGQLLLRLMFRLEDWFPHVTARVGRFPMVIIRKHLP